MRDRGPYAPEAVPFSIGTVLGRSSGLVLRNFFPFLWMTFVVALPIAIFIFLIVLIVPAHFDVHVTKVEFQFDSGAGNISAVVVALLATLASFAIQAAVATRAIQALRDAPAGIGLCLRQAFGTMPRLLGTGVLQLLAYGGIVALMVAMFALCIKVGANFVLATVPVLLGFAALFFLFVVWWVFLPAMLVEQAGPIAALRRSWIITRGYRWRILGLLLIIALVHSLLQYLVSLAFPRDSTLGGILLVLLALVAFFYGTAAAAVGYTLLRWEKDGPKSLAAIFD